jgi:hypothetical protein
MILADLRKKPYLNRKAASESQKPFPGKERALRQAYTKAYFRLPIMSSGLTH